jgi:hypothetical protein
MSVTHALLDQGLQQLVCGIVGSLLTRAAHTAATRAAHTAATRAANRRGTSHSDVLARRIDETDQVNGGQDDIDRGRG